MKYQQPFQEADPDASYVDKDVPGAVRGSAVRAAAVEHHQRELVHLIEFSGQTPSAADLQQVRKAVQAIAAPAPQTHVATLSANYVPVDGSYTVIPWDTGGNPSFGTFSSGVLTFSAAGNYRVHAICVHNAGGEMTLSILHTASGTLKMIDSAHDWNGNAAVAYETVLSVQADLFSVAVDDTLDIRIFRASSFGTVQAAHSGHPIVSALRITKVSRT